MASTSKSIREKFGSRLLIDTPPKVLLDLLEEGFLDLSKNGPNMALRSLAIQTLKNNIIDRVRTNIKDEITRAFLFKDEKFKKKFRCQDKDKSCQWYSDWTRTYFLVYPPMEDNITVQEAQLIHLLDCLYDVLCKAGPFLTYTLKDLLASLALINPMIPATISKKWNFKSIDMRWKLETVEEPPAESTPAKIEPKEISQTTPPESTPVKSAPKNISEATSAESSTPDKIVPKPVCYGYISEATPDVPKPVWYGYKAFLRELEATSAESYPDKIVPKSTEPNPSLLSGKVPVAVLFTTLDKALNNIVKTNNDANLKKFAAVVLELNDFSKYCEDMERIIDDVCKRQNHPHSVTLQALGCDEDGNSKWYGKRQVHANVNKIVGKDVIIELLYKLLSRFDDIDTTAEFLYDDYELQNKGKYDVLSSSYCFLQMRKNIWKSIRQAHIIFNETNKAPETVKVFFISVINGHLEKVPVIMSVDDWNNIPFAK